MLPCSGTQTNEPTLFGRVDMHRELLESERAAILGEAIHELPAIYREVLSLRFEEGMKLEEIAEVAAVPLSTVKSRLHRALESVREAVERRLRGRWRK